MNIYTDIQSFLHIYIYIYIYICMYIYICVHSYICVNSIYFVNCIISFVIFLYIWGPHLPPVASISTSPSPCPSPWPHLPATPRLGLKGAGPPTPERDRPHCCRARWGTSPHPEGLGGPPANVDWGSMAERLGDGRRGGAEYTYLCMYINIYIYILTYTYIHIYMYIYT